MKRILWVGKAAESGEAGDEIYDRKMIAALRALGHSVSHVAPRRVSAVRELANLVRGVPHYRSRYQTRHNVDLVRQASRECEVAICSWEPFDMLACQLDCPTIPILHNVSSSALPAAFPNSLIAKALAGRAESWERLAYSSGRFHAIGVLSLADRDRLQQLAPHANVVHLPPGLPPVVPLAADAVFRSDIIVSGTYDWRPKRRDIIAFAREYAASGARWPVYADKLPNEAAVLLSPRLLGALTADAAIRIGMVPDRFVAGHKLKVGSYIAANAIPLSMVDIWSELGEGPDDPLVRRLSSISEIGNHVRALEAIPADTLRGRWLEFQAKTAEKFSWERSAASLSQLVASA
ncbi:hypothetical protein [Devosia sp. 2618]|uniref:hypothetical protein n=1 Tax=Devosia sp. 2618 TaxID=3156454 RepID=UPI0033956C68